MSWSVATFSVLSDWWGWWLSLVSALFFGFLWDSTMMIIIQFETRTSKTYFPRYLTKEWNFRKEIPFGNLVVLPRWLYGSVVLGTRWNLLDTAMPELVSDDDLVSTVFVKGAQVKLCDLSKRPELNGKCGTLTPSFGWRSMGNRDGRIWTLGVIIRLPMFSSPRTLTGFFELKGSCMSGGGLHELHGLTGEG